MEREIIRLKSLSTYREKLGSSNLCVQTAGSSWKKFLKREAAIQLVQKVIAKRATSG